MKMQYQSASIEVIRFQATDIIATSGAEANGKNKTEKNEYGGSGTKTIEKRI